MPTLITLNKDRQHKWRNILHAFKKPSLRVLLIGAGTFGIKHLNTLYALHKNGSIFFKGVVVRTSESQKKLSSQYDLEIFTELTDSLLRSVDAVVIATPAETHYELAKRCLPYTHVLIEKPISEFSWQAAELEELANKHNKILMPGHIFRFHPITQWLKKNISHKDIETISGTFTNSAASDLGRSIPHEILHWFDVADFLLNETVANAWGTTKERVMNADIRYQNGVQAHFRLGWDGEQKERFLEIKTKRQLIRGDYLTYKLIIKNKDGLEKIICIKKYSDLEKELHAFIKAVKNKNKLKIESSIGTRILRIIETVKKNTVLKERPKIAIIGAGIFGVNCALELDSIGDVTLFDRNSDIMAEASYINQYRHHWGYHYPRSVETVRDIQAAIPEFETHYNDAIIRNFPTYYSIAKKGSRVSADAYINFCEQNKLPFELEYPDEKFLNREATTTCLKTYEPIYDYQKLKNLIKHRLEKTNIQFRYNTEVINASFDENGQKVLEYIGTDGIKKKDTFDYIIHAAYSNYNLLSHWLKFPVKPLRIDRTQTLIVRLNIPKISIAVMDGPFTNLVSTGEDNLFTLVHIKESKLEVYNPVSGIIPDKPKAPPNTSAIIEKSSYWIPVLKDAEIIESRFVYRAVNANHEHDDARPSDIENYGFGCWSVLGGKIVNCVSTAQKIYNEIKRTL